MAETTPEFAERIHQHFIREIGTSWNQWPRTQRWALARKLLSGIHPERYDHLDIYRDKGYLGDLSWEEVLSGISWADQEPQPQCRSPRAQEANDPMLDQIPQTVFALTQPPATRAPTSASHNTRLVAPIPYFPDPPYTARDR